MDFCHFSYARYRAKKCHKCLILPDFGQFTPMYSMIPGGDAENDAVPRVPVHRICWRTGFGIEFPPESTILPAKIIRTCSHRREKGGRMQKWGEVGVRDHFGIIVRQIARKPPCRENGCFVHFCKYFCILTPLHQYSFAQ